MSARFFKVYLIIFIYLIGSDIHSQSDSFGVKYPALTSMTFIDVEYLPDEFLIGLTGDFSTFDLLLIDTDNYQVIDSLSLDNYNFELVDLYKDEDRFKLTGVHILDSTLHSLQIEIENNKLTIIPKLQGELPSYYVQGIARFGLPYTVILETISYNREDFGCISSGSGISVLFKITEDSIRFEIPSPTLA